MKTNLPNSITTIAEAKVFITELHTNGESYHPEADAHYVNWLSIQDITNEPTYNEATHLNTLMGEIYNLPGNDGRHCEPMVFDPCEFLNELDEASVPADTASDGEPADDRIFLANDLVEFSMRIADYAKGNVTREQVRAFAEEQVTYEPGDYSFVTYKMPNNKLIK